MAILGLLLLSIFSFIKSYVHHSHFELAWQADALLELLRDMGIAAIVAATVSLGIEKISRAELRREIGEERNKFLESVVKIDSSIKEEQQKFTEFTRSEITNIEESVFNGVFSRRLPVAYAEMIGDQLSDLSWFRQDSNMTIDILSSDDKLISDSLVEYQLTHSYRQVNITTKELEFQQRLYLDVSADGTEPEIVTWKVGEHALSTDEIATAKQVLDSSSSARFFKFPKTIVVPPGGTIHVYYKSRKMKFARDTTTHCLFHPSDGIRLTVNHHPALKVFVDPKTPQTPTEFPEESDGHRVTIEIFKPILPYFTIEIGWKPR